MVYRARSLVTRLHQSIRNRCCDSQAICSSTTACVTVRRSLFSDARMQKVPPINTDQHEIVLDRRCAREISRKGRVFDMEGASSAFIKAIKGKYAGPRSHSAMLAAAATAGDAGLAQELLKSAKVLCGDVDDFIMSAYVTAMTRGGRKKEAISVAQSYLSGKQKKDQLNSKEEESMNNGSIVLSNAALRGMQFGRDSKAAKQLLQSIESPNSHTLAAVVDLCRSEGPEAVLYTWRQVSSRLKEPIASVAWQRLICTLVELGSVSEALHKLQEWMEMLKHHADSGTHQQACARSSHTKRQSSSRAMDSKLSQGTRDSTLTFSEVWDVHASLSAIVSSPEASLRTIQSSLEAVSTVVTITDAKLLTSLFNAFISKAGTSNLQYAKPTHSFRLHARQQVQHWLQLMLDDGVILDENLIEAALKVTWFLPATDSAKWVLCLLERMVQTGFDKDPRMCGLAFQAFLRWQTMPPSSLPIISPPPHGFESLDDWMCRLFEACQVSISPSSLAISQEHIQAVKEVLRSVKQLRWGYANSPRLVEWAQLCGLKDGGLSSEPDVSNADIRWTLTNCAAVAGNSEAVIQMLELCERATGRVPSARLQSCIFKAISISGSEPDPSSGFDMMEAIDAGFKCQDVGTESSDIHIVGKKRSPPTGWVSLASLAIARIHGLDSMLSMLKRHKFQGQMSEEFAGRLVAVLLYRNEFELADHVLKEGILLPSGQTWRVSSIGMEHCIAAAAAKQPLLLDDWLGRMVHGSIPVKVSPACISSLCEAARLGPKALSHVCRTTIRSLVDASLQKKPGMMSPVELLYALDEMVLLTSVLLQDQEVAGSNHGAEENSSSLMLLSAAQDKLLQSIRSGFPVIHRQPGSRPRR